MVTTRKWAVALRESEKKWRGIAEGAENDSQCVLCHIARQVPRRLGQTACVNCPLEDCDSKGTWYRAWLFCHWNAATTSQVPYLFAARQLAEQLGRLADEYERRAEEEERHHAKAKGQTVVFVTSEDHAKRHLTEDV